MEQLKAHNKTYFDQTGFDRVKTDLTRQLKKNLLLRDANLYKQKRRYSIPYRTITRLDEIFQRCEDLYLKIKKEEHLTRKDYANTHCRHLIFIIIFTDENGHKHLFL